MISTQQDWWNLVERNWEDLSSILWRFLPMDEREIIDEETNTVVLSPDLKTMAQHVDRLQREKNSHLARYFFAAWDSAPDSPEIHVIPGWAVLCDLCSEEHVLYDS